jgi:ABC-2 type transport system permease protein
MSSDLGLVRHQFRFDRKRFFRDPAGLFYGIVFPLVFLVNFLILSGSSDEVGHIAGHALPSKYYYLPAVLTMAVVSVTFVNLAVSLTGARERGTLKRVRGTPVPTWAFLAGRLATSVAVTAVSVVVVAVVGRVAYGVAVPGETLLGALLVLIVATFAFCCLAFAVTAVLPTANTAAAITMTLTLVLYFLSGVFAREDNLSHGIRTIAAVFPIKRLFQALAVAYDPQTTGLAIRGWDLAVLAAWGFGGLLVALRFFRWQPRTS